MIINTSSSLPHKSFVEFTCTVNENKKIWKVQSNLVKLRNDGLVVSAIVL